MTIGKGLLYVTAGIALFVGANAGYANDTEAGKIQTGHGKMEVIYNGGDSTHLDFGVDQWMPGIEASASIGIINAGDFAFDADVSIIDDTATNNSILDDMNAEAILDDGTVLYEGSFDKLKISEITVDKNASRGITINVTLPEGDDQNDLQGLSSSFSVKVTAQQSL